MSLTFWARVSERGDIRLPVFAPGRFLKYSGQEVVVEIRRPKDIRSSRANRYYHGVIVPFYQERWSEGRVALGLPPYTHDETHEVLVQVLTPGEPGPVPGTVVRRRTHTMTSKEFYEEITEKARAYAWDTYQVRIPEPNEREEAE